MATRMDVTMVEMPIGSPELRGSWPVYWSAVWVGTLAALSLALIGGLLAVAFGAYHVAGRPITAGQLGLPELIASVCVGFFSFVIGGWVTTRIAGLRRAEPAMLHGGVLWLLGVPILFVLIALGGQYGGWYGGLAGTPAWAVPGAAMTAEAARRAGGGAATALLLGLVGAVLGAWMGCGEPMHFAHYRTRDRAAASRP